METFQIRTDLALEARESVNEEESKLRGVSVDEHYEEETDIRITKVTIDTKNAEKTLGKPMGVYVTMEAPAMVEPDDVLTTLSGDELGNTCYGSMCSVGRTECVAYVIICKIC